MIAPLVGALLVGQLTRVPRRPKPTPPPPVTTSIDLTIKTTAGETRGSVSPKLTPPSVRPLATLKSGEKPQIRWMIRNLDARLPVSNVVVHFLINKESGAGAAIPEGPQKGSFQDSVLGTDLPPRDYTSGEYGTALYEPGYYLVEMELLDQQGLRRQYIAFDLQVK